MVKWILMISYTIFLIFTIGRIFRSVKNPAKTLLWILVVIAIPIFGLLFYYFIGRSPSKDKFFKQKGPFHKVKKQLIRPEYIPDSKHRFIQLMHQNNSAALSYGNRVTILKDGDETFKEIFKELKKAKSSIHMDFYIVENGDMLNECLKICEEKIKQGVQVRLIYDGFGTFELSSKIKKRITEIGIEQKEFFPFHLGKLFKFINYRNHRKIIIIDNQVAFTGGMNISDKYMTVDKKLGLWRDTFVKIEGPAAMDFEQIFKSDWFYSNGQPYSLLIETVKEHDDGSPVQVVASGPDSEYKGIMHEYFTVITDSEDYVYLVTPYFIPGEGLITALKTAAMSGIDIRIMIPYDSDSRWMKWCMFTYLEELMAAQVRIFLFHDGFLHGKVIISDDFISSVGTANIDDRSFEANFEVNAVVYDRKTAIQLKNQFLEDIKFCEELSLIEFPYRKDRNKIMEPLARLSSSVL